MALVNGVANSLPDKMCGDAVSAEIVRFKFVPKLSDVVVFG